MKSPFIVFDEFLSPLQCEEIIINNNVNFPSIDKDGNPIPMFFGNRLWETRICPHLVDIVIPDIEEHYGVDVKGITKFNVEYYPEGYTGSMKPRCENSRLDRGKWIRVNENDFAGIIFLNEYNDKSPFDSEFEVYGGELGFPTHGFSFYPRRGTLIIFPGTSHFINHTAAINMGELTQIRFHVATHEHFVYNPQDYPGDYNVWFKDK